MKKLFYSLFAITMAVFSFTSCEDVPEPYNIPEKPGTGGEQGGEEELQGSGAGTLLDPYDCIAAINYCKQLGADTESTENIYIKGKIVSIEEEYGTQYGNGSFTISNDGSNSNTFKVWRALYLGNKKYTSGKTQIQVGDEVVIYGKVIYYYGNTAETSQGNAYLYSLNGVSEDAGGDTPDEPQGEAKGSGTLDDPYNCAAAIAFTSALGKDEKSDKEVYIKGIVSSIKYEYDTTYGNGTFNISDDGTTNNEFLVWRALYLGNVKYTAGQEQPHVGDEVIICGKVVNYYGNTPETVQGEAYLYSLKCNYTSGGDEPDGDDNPDTNEGITISGTTVTLANSGVEAGSESITIDLSTLGYSNAQDVESIELEDGTVVTFDKNGETNGPKYYDGTKGIRVYKNNIIKFEGKAKIATVVFGCDSYNGTDYVGNATATLASSGNSLTYTNLYTEASGGGVQLRIKTIKITYAK